MKNFNEIFYPILAFAIVAFVGIALKGCAGWSDIACASVGAATAEVALFAKEFYDKVIKGTKFDWADIEWGQIGVVLGFLCVWQLLM